MKSRCLREEAAAKSEGWEKEAPRASYPRVAAQGWHPGEKAAAKKSASSFSRRAGTLRKDFSAFPQKVGIPTNKRSFISTKKKGPCKGRKLGKRGGIAGKLRQTPPQGGQLRKGAPSLPQQAGIPTNKRSFISAKKKSSAKGEGPRGHRPAGPKRAKEYPPKRMHPLERASMLFIHILLFWHLAGF